LSVNETTTQQGGGQLQKSFLLTLASCFTTTLAFALGGVATLAFALRGVATLAFALRGVATLAFALGRGSKAIKVKVKESDFYILK
jgi:hypothetical protein